MLDIGTNTLRAASRFARTAQDAAVGNDLSRALGTLGELTQPCVACHTGFRLKRYKLPIDPKTIAMHKTRILFLCTGNSCRSQIAEGWGKHLGHDIAEVESAGIEAHGKNPRAIAVMAEAGVDISGQESTRVTDDMIRRADIVVTVCGHADEHCPVLPPGVKKIHWPLTDPAKATGDIQGRMSAAGDRTSDAATEDEIMAQFRATRDELRRRVADLINSLDIQTRSA